jgi:hypothetical protein
VDLFLIFKTPNTGIHMAKTAEAKKRGGAKTKSCKDEDDAEEKEDGNGSGDCSSSDENEDLTKQEAAERITRFIRLVADKKCGRLKSKAEELLVQSPKKKKRMRRSSFAKDVRNLRSSVTEGETIVEGSLKKKSSGRFKKWQPRYFRLGGHYLKYWDKEGSKDIKGVVDLRGVASVTQNEDSPLQLILAMKEPEGENDGTTVTTAAGQDTWLEAPSMKKMEEWLEGLQLVLGLGISTTTTTKEEDKDGRHSAEKEAAAACVITRFIRFAGAKIRGEDSPEMHLLRGGVESSSSSAGGRKAKLDLANVGAQVAKDQRKKKRRGSLLVLGRG